MKLLLFIFILLFIVEYSQAQSDSLKSGYVEPPFNEYVQYIYNPETKNKTFSYN